MGQPKFMSLLTVANFAQKLKTYCEKAEVRQVQIVFHGGEPLLLKPDYFVQCLNIFKAAAPDLDIRFAVQTNGVTLDQDWYTLFNENRIAVGISLDGPEKYHDKYRVFHNDKGSYTQVARAVRLGKENELAGILMVVNTAIPVEELYEEIKQLGAERCNLLLPDGHYHQLPDGFDPAQFGRENYTPYADWLIDLYKIWKKDVDRPKIHFFESLIEMVAGVEGLGNQLIGRRVNGVIGVETDGGLEIADSMRACYEGITKNDININKNNIEDLFEEDIFELYYHAHNKVCEQCLNCPIYDICGGGFLAHRYAQDNGFDNPTMYCKDMIRLVTFIQNDFLDSLSEQVVEQLGIERLTYQDIMEELDKPSLNFIDAETRQNLISYKQTEMV